MVEHDDDTNEDAQTGTEASQVNQAGARLALTSRNPLTTTPALTEVGLMKLIDRGGEVPEKMRSLSNAVR